MGDLWSARFFFLTTWWAGYFFTAVQEFFSITFVLHAIFFFRQALAGIFFFKITHPLPQELNGRHLIQLFNLLAKDVIIIKIIYALGSAHEKFGVLIEAVPESKFPTKPGGKNDWAVPSLFQALS